MEIKVNGRAVEVFAGARVEDALRQYSRLEWTLVRKHKKIVCDKYGHEVGLDGELNGGEELVTKAGAAVEPRS